jgi:hypothetical protein
MGIWDAFTDIVEAVTPWSVVEAEAPAEEPQEENDSKTEESKDEPEEEEAEEEEEEEEEEEDDEPVDPKETLEEGSSIIHANIRFQQQRAILATAMHLYAIITRNMYILTHSQSVRTLPNVPPLSTTSMSALSVFSSRRVRVVPRRTVSKSSSTLPTVRPLAPPPSSGPSSSKLTSWGYRFLRRWNGYIHVEKIPRAGTRQDLPLQEAASLYECSSIWCQVVQGFL